MRTDLPALFAATILACGEPPDDQDIWRLTKYNLAVFTFWQDLLPASLMNSNYERTEMAKMLYNWHQAERLFAV